MTGGAMGRDVPVPAKLRAFCQSGHQRILSNPKPFRACALAFPGRREEDWSVVADFDNCVGTQGMQVFAHAGIGWILAEAGRGDRRFRQVVFLASLLPDLDGLSLLFGPEAYSRIFLLSPSASDWFPMNWNRIRFHDYGYSLTPSRSRMRF